MKSGTDYLMPRSANPSTISSGCVLNRVRWPIACFPATANLVANPGFLQSGMLRGEQRFVEFEVRNLRPH